jgi:hypothetical protein
MSLQPSTLPQAVNLVHVRVASAPHGDPQQRELAQRLRGLDSTALWRGAVLALMADPDNATDHATWHALVDGLPQAPRLFSELAQLDAARRLPWLEHFARLLATGSVDERHELIVAARRVLIADRVVSAMDQLRWITLRHLLAGSAVAPPAAAPTEFEQLDLHQVVSICRYCGFLSTLVPTPEITLDPTGYGSVSQTWYDTVTAPWVDRAQVPARHGHDIDAALRALRELQSMPWLVRPVLVRSWYDAARELTQGPVLHPGAADALRLSCTLLDCPLPPELIDQYVEVEPARHH